MKKNRSNRKSKGGNSTESPRSHGASRSAPHIIATKNETCENISQKGCEEHYESLQSKAESKSNNNTAGFYSADHSVFAGHGSPLPSIPLTSQTLSEHTLEQASVARQQEQARTFEATIAPPDGRMLSLLGGGGGPFQSEPFYKNFLPSVHDQQKDNASLYNEADSDITDHHPDSGHWQSGIFHGDHVSEVRVMNLPILDISDVDPLSWEIESVRGEQLPAWGSALAGIGGLFAGYPNQEYNRHDEFIID